MITSFINYFIVTFKKYAIFPIMCFTLLASSFFGTPVSILVAAGFFIYLYQRKKFLEIMVLFWYCTIWSDTRHFQLAPFYAAKMVVIGLMSVGLLNSKNFGGKYSKFANSFVPFFVVAFISVFFSDEISGAFQKTLSYLIIMLVFPTYILASFRREGPEFVRKYVMAGTLVIFTSFIWYIFKVPQGFFAGNLYEASGFASATEAVENGIINENVGRFNGIFGNPNGMGIYCNTFFIFFTICRYYYKEMFSKYEVIGIYAMTLACCIWCGSRGGLFSMVIFLSFIYISKRTSNTVAFFIFLIMVISYQTATIFIKDIFEALGLTENFRTGDIEKGSGRLVAITFLWEQIQRNFFFSKGWGYTDGLFAQNQDSLNALGHSGGAHNSFLQVWGDLGLVGLILFLFGWGSQFWAVASKSPFAVPMMLSFMFSAFVESWLIGSLNPWTCVLVSIIALFNIKEFIEHRNTNMVAEPTPKIQLAV